MIISSFPFNGVRVVPVTVTDTVSHYVVHCEGLTPVPVTVDWAAFGPDLKTNDVLDHAIDRALRASKQWTSWRDVYCGSA